MTKLELLKQIEETTVLCDCVDTTYLASQDDEIDHDMLSAYIYEYNIIYYHNAMKFLSENDPSLRDSLTLANDMGCDMNNLNSEALATMLFQDMALDELNDLDIAA